MNNHPYGVKGWRREEGMPQMDSREDFELVVDELVDDLDVSQLVREADRLGVTVDSLLMAVVTEIKARLEP
jgi:hypothetical protein